MNYNNKHNIPIISLFTGGGFMDMGFINAGFDVVFANEYDKVFAKLHDEGMSSWCREHKQDFCPITRTESLTDLSPEQILTKAFPDGEPKIWGVIGGPPCQDFTMRGKGEGFNGSRGKMTQIYLERIQQMRPAFFVMENVVGLLMRKDAKRTLDSLILNLISNDYFIDRNTLNALEYGVPQDRKRVFLIGLRKDIFKLTDTQKNSLDNICSFRFAWPTPLYPNAVSAYKWPLENSFGSESIAKPQGIPSELCVEKCLENAENLPNGDECISFAKGKENHSQINEGDTKRRSFKRLHRFRYSPTTCFGNNEVFLHPYKNRRINVREALRLQSVDDCYIWDKYRLTAKFKVISNGVPVLLAQKVAEKLIEILNQSVNK